MLTRETKNISDHIIDKVVEAGDGDGEQFGDMLDYNLKRVGFGWSPATPEEFLIDTLEGMVTRD
jgi:hypothetical protein